MKSTVAFSIGVRCDAWIVVYNSRLFTGIEPPSSIIGLLSQGGYTYRCTVLDKSKSFPEFLLLSSPLNKPVGLQKGAHFRWSCNCFASSVENRVHTVFSDLNEKIEA